MALIVGGGLQTRGAGRPTERRRSGSAWRGATQLGGARGWSAGEGDGVAVRLAGFGPRGHTRHQRAGVSSEEPGREPSDSREREADQAAGRGGAGASGFTQGTWFGLEIQRHLSGQGLEFQGWPWAQRPAWRFVSQVPRGEN